MESARDPRREKAAPDWNEELLRCREEAWKSKKINYLSSLLVCTATAEHLSEPNTLTGPRDAGKMGKILDRTYLLAIIRKRLPPSPMTFPKTVARRTIFLQGENWVESAVGKKWRLPLFSQFLPDPNAGDSIVPWPPAPDIITWELVTCSTSYSTRTYWVGIYVLTRSPGDPSAH